MDKAGQEMLVVILPGCTCGFKILTAVVPQSEVQALSRGGLLDDIGVPAELITDRAEILALQQEKDHEDGDETRRGKGID